MARISLLIFIAVVLAIGSVSAHPPKKTKKNLCPPTLSKLQTFPSTEISKLIEKKIKSAPNTPQFNTLFATCKVFSEYLAVGKSTAVKRVFGSLHAKYAVMTEAMYSAQVAVGVEGALAARIRKSFRAMADGFVELETVMAEISAKYKFDANAEISKSDRVKVEKCVIKLKGYINVFVKVITKCSAKFAGKQVGNPVNPNGYLDGFIKKGVQFGGNFIGSIGGNAGGAVGGNAGVEGNAGAGFGGNVGAGVGSDVGAGVGGLIGSMIGGRGRGKAGGRGKGKVGGLVGGEVGGLVGGNVGAQGEAQIGGQTGAGGNADGQVGGQAGVEFGGKVGGKAKGKGKGKGKGKVGGKVGAQGELKVGGNAGAKVGGEAKAGCGPTTGAKVGGQAGGVVGSKTEVNVGGNAGGSLGFGGGLQYDAAGKAHLGGGSAFRPLSHTSSKHLD